MPNYINDPDNHQKQIPSKKPNGIHRFSHAINPAAQDVVKRPSYVIVNRPGVYLFAYESGSYPSEYISGSVINNAASGPLRLDINPVAWGKETGEVIGDVTFVYVRVS